MIASTRTIGVSRQSAIGVPSVLVAIAGGFMIFSLPAWLVTLDVFRFVVFAASFLIGVLFALYKGKSLSPRGRGFALGLVIWWFLLLSEAVFTKMNVKEAALEGAFTQAAYGKAASWVLMALVLAAYSLLRPAYLRLLASGSFKWLFLFGLLCLFSALYAPALLFSFVWAIKLCLAILVLCLCAWGMRDISDVRELFRTIFWAFLALGVAPLLQVFIDPSLLFARAGRLGGEFGPTGISTIGGVIIILSLMIYFIEGRKWLLLAGTFGFVIMVLGGGKTAQVATLIAIVIFLAFSKRFTSMLGFCLAILPAGVMALYFSPVLEYYRAYWEKGRAGTLTGRIPLWQAAWDAILQNPIMGHGYMSSKLISVHIVMPTHWQATHLHNVVLEILYNNGLVGLFVMLVILYRTSRNLVKVFRSKPSRELYLLTFGTSVLFGYLITLGLMRPTFGGRPTNDFMLFLALVVLSELLRRVIAEHRKSYAY